MKSEVMELHVLLFNPLVNLLLVCMYESIIEDSLVREEIIHFRYKYSPCPYDAGVVQVIA
jgi:hypothetical protein